MSTTYVPSPVEVLQLDIGAIVQAAPYFAGVVVNVVRPRVDLTATMIQNNIQNALIGVSGGGATVVVDMPLGEVPDSEAPGPDLRTVCKVRVIENPLINMGASGTFKSAEDLTLALLNLLHGRFWGRFGATMTADKDAYQPIMDYVDKGYVANECRFNIRLGLSGPAKVPMPGISGTPSSVIIQAINTANVYYTTDGTYPWSGNPTAQLFSDLITNLDGSEIDNLDGSPIQNLPETLTVAPGTLVLAVAYQNGKQASDLAATIIS